MTAWQELLAKSTAPSGSTAWVHLVSQSPGGGPGGGINAVMVPTGTLTLSGYFPSVRTSNVRIKTTAGELKFTGGIPTAFAQGPTIARTQTGSIVFQSYTAPPYLDPARKFTVSEHYRFYAVPENVRTFTVEYHERYVTVPEDEIGDN